VDVFSFSTILALSHHVTICIEYQMIDIVLETGDCMCTCGQGVCVCVHVRMCVRTGEGEGEREGGHAHRS
jgi:hypothetical protein